MVLVAPMCRVPLPFELLLFCFDPADAAVPRREIFQRSRSSRSKVSLAKSLAVV